MNNLTLAPGSRDEISFAFPDRSILESVKPDPSVLISCITRESIHAQTAQWLANQRYEVDIVQLPYTIAHNRNVQVERFLATKYDYIFIVDADVLPSLILLRGC